MAEERQARRHCEGLNHREARFANAPRRERCADLSPDEVPAIKPRALRDAGRIGPLERRSHDPSRFRRHQAVALRLDRRPPFLSVEGRALSGPSDGGHLHPEWLLLRRLPPTGEKRP